MKVSVNPPKTPVTKGSRGVASATMPNVCKMPGPPAPFVLTALPNVGKSGDSPKGYTKNVKVGGHSVAIRGASFKSKGDAGSKASGGGMLSANTHGPTTFAGPGSRDVKFEGKSVHLLGEPMFNNCNPAGRMPNSATMVGLVQESGVVTAVEAGSCPLCGQNHGELSESEQTKSDAGALASNFKVEVESAKTLGATMDPPVKVVVNTMLGVAECKCGKKYADQSAMTTVEFCNAASSSGMTHLPGATVSYVHGRERLSEAYFESLKRMKIALGDQLGNSDLFMATWSKAEERAIASDKDRSGPASYPPGTCAAQGALLMLMDDGALPAAMTEQWFSNVGSKTQAKIAFIQIQGDSRLHKAEKFKPGQTVPPCGSCELIVPLLLCHRGKQTCNH